MLWSICRVHMIYEHARHVPTPPLLWLRYAKARTRQRPRTLRLLPIRGLNLLSPEISSYVAKLPPRANAEKTKGKKTNMERKARPMAREAANWRGPVAAVWTPFGHTAAAPCPKRGRLGMMVLKNRHQWSQVHVPLRKGKASRKKARQNMQHDQNKHPRRRQPQSEKQRQRQRQQSPKQRPGEGLSLNHMIPKSFVNVSWLMRSMHSRRLMTSKTFALKFLQAGEKVTAPQFKKYAKSLIPEFWWFSIQNIYWTRGSVGLTNVDLGKDVLHFSFNQSSASEAHRMAAALKCAIIAATQRTMFVNFGLSESSWVWSLKISKFRVSTYTVTQGLHVMCPLYIQIAFSWQCLYPRRQRWTMKSPLKRIAQSMKRWSTIAIWPCFCSPMANEHMGGLYLHGSHHAHRQLQLCQAGPTLLLYI